MDNKVIAFYLPQFHRIPENDEWWGKGFTDWKGVRKAQPLFHGHRQPREPKNGYYYNLLDKKTLEWQADLARKYNVYGFCIYHYWFGEKQLLEKPAENLLMWKDIDVNYCFSWANESWVASWSKLKGNAWAESVTKPSTKGGYLVKQKYGGKSEWERHFAYLLPFFKDKRYIKINNSPIFVIYKPENIKVLQEMMLCWHELARENGFNSIYFVGTNYKEWKEKGMDAMLLYEPSYTLLGEKGRFNTKAYLGLEIQKWMEKHQLYFPKLINYDAVWKMIIKRKNKGNVWPGAFVDFDSTPRKGKNGSICIGVSPKKFEKYIYSLAKNNSDKEFIFIMAWNEWGEGAYLEPDKSNNVSYLHSIKRLKGKEKREVESQGLEKKIPKVIHYVWFGKNPKSHRVKKCIASWKKYCPDYKIIEWNEDNYNIKKNRYMYEAYKAKKWAFASDYARFDIIYTYGGIYFDTDVELVSGIDDFLYDDMFMGFLKKSRVASGLGFGSVAQNPIIKEILDYYENRSFYKADGEMDLQVCNYNETEVLVKHGLVRNGKEQWLDHGHIYPSEVFNSDSVIPTGKAVAINHFAGSWATFTHRTRNQKNLFLARHLGRKKVEISIRITDKIWNIFEFIEQQLKNIKIQKFVHSYWERVRK